MSISLGNNPESFTEENLKKLRTFFLYTCGIVNTGLVTLVFFFLVTSVATGGNYLFGKSFMECLILVFPFLVFIKPLLSINEGEKQFQKFLETKDIACAKKYHQYFWKNMAEFMFGLSLVSIIFFAISPQIVSFVTITLLLIYIASGCYFWKHQQIFATNWG